MILGIIGYLLSETLVLKTLKSKSDIYFLTRAKSAPS